MTAPTPAATDGTAPPPTVAAALLELLRLEGVTHAFGVPGGALVSILVALKDDPSITYHPCRHESGAAYIADGYARVSGGLGVVITTSGPGATNALSGTLNADVEGTPLLLLTGEVKEQFFGRGYLQEGADATLDLVAVYRNAVAYSEMVTDAENAIELTKSALRTALGTPGRAAHLSIPGDVAAAAASGFTVPASTASYRATDRAVDAAGVADAVLALTSARRPLLLLGEHCRGPLQDDGLLGDLVAAVEHLSLPVSTTASAKGVFPESHALSLRNYGVAACTWPAAYLDGPDGHFDALVVIGSALGGLATDNWNPALLPDGPLIQVDEDPGALGRAVPITRGVVGETTAALRAFVEAAARAEVDAEQAERRRALVATIKESSPTVRPEQRTSTSDPITPQALMRVVGEVLPSGSQVLVDAGNCVGWCLHELVIDPPTRLHSALTMGPMGFATAAVVGARLAAPTVPCLAVTGDGAFMMQVAEVATAAQHDVGAIWVVLADDKLNMVSQGMAAVTGDPSFDELYGLGHSDLGTVAQGLGAQATTTSSVAGVTEALQRALAGADAGVPQVVVVQIDTTEMPPYRYPTPPPAPPAQQA